ncbi:MAG TPA: ATP-binding protein [Myxococcales bacterium]
MTRKRLAALLAALVVLSGILPLILLSIAGLQLVRRRGERASNEALDAVAAQAAARISAYVSQQREMLRTLSMAVGAEPDAARRLRDATLDAPSLGQVRIVTKNTPPSQVPKNLPAELLAKAIGGEEVVSPTYLLDLSPAMDACTPSGIVAQAVCATLDLLELQRQVQRIRVGERGHALAFDRQGHVLAAGEGALRGAVVSGEPIAESPAAEALAQGGAPRHRLRNGLGVDTLVGWASLPDLGWTIAVEQPAAEALRGAREALIVLGLGSVAALLLSVSLGYAQARKMFLSLEMEERFRTAGQLAAGITHDLGHRLTILRQIEQLAATGDPDYLPRIRASLSEELGTLRRFVADFSDLTREANPSEFLPLELNAFADSIRDNAAGYGTQAAVTVGVEHTEGPIWVNGDRFLLERAALNLTRNAIEASPPGSSVTLSVHKNGELAEIRVEDRGTGIDSERLPTLFESFKSTKRTGAHIGMGLPNVRRIMMAHKGSVSVRSLVGKGSVFTLTLPVQSSASPSFS